jgi:SAM-dependent methyltransferase
MGRLTALLPGGIRKHYLRPLATRLKSRDAYRREYDSKKFFDQFHGLTDRCDGRVTIAPEYPELDARFHYNAVENAIILYLKRHRVQARRVLDIGSGTGHWIDFYLSCAGATAVTGVDISEVAVRKLKRRFQNEKTVNIVASDVVDLQLGAESELDLINAIGVMFHIVADEKWEKTIQWCERQLRPGGVLIASGLFGRVTANVQFEPVEFSSVEEYRGGSELACNKRVRSKRYWRRVLKTSGFRRITFVRTRRPRGIRAPENNLLFAVK